uniref:Uncharacterized protein n=1 Tax=Heterorhabditis bacteriophora TaxID=37862 RepID=A0A1I7WF19_HETBA
MIRNDEDKSRRKVGSERRARSISKSKSQQGIGERAHPSRVASVVSILSFYSILPYWVNYVLVSCRVAQRLLTL